MEGSDSFTRSAEAGQAISVLLASVLFALSGLLQVFLDSTDRSTYPTAVVASIGRAPAFGPSFLSFGALFWVARKVSPGQRADRLEGNARHARVTFLRSIEGRRGRRRRSWCRGGLTERRANTCTD